MADPPPLPDDLEECVDDFLNKRIKAENITKNSSGDLLNRQMRLWKGRAACFAFEKGRYDVYDQIGEPNMKKVASLGIKCGGAHNIGAECECGFGHCIDCGKWVRDTCGWGIRCNDAKCILNGPTNVVDRPVTIAVTPDPKPARKIAGKKARGRAKRVKGLGGAGGGGGGSTASEESEDGVIEATTPSHSPPGSPIPGLWQPIPLPVPKKKTPGGGKGKKVVPTAPACAIVHAPNDICEECGVNSCIICHQPKSKTVPWNATKGYNCGCGGGPAPVPPPVAPATQIDLTDDTVTPVALPGEPPKHWSPPQPGSSPYITQSVDLEPGSVEYKHVVENYLNRNILGGVLFKFGNGHEAYYVGESIRTKPTLYTVVKVTRIQNLANTVSYNGYLQGVMANRGIKLEDAEETVFHGTSYDSALAIAKTGFNRFKTATAAFGYGSYHDPYGPLSQYHAETCGSEPACVVVSKIASGVVGEGKFGDIAPPPGCDCGASGADKQSWMRISYHDSQVCPQYILHIKRGS
jgi:hypothetical protein